MPFMSEVPRLYDEFASWFHLLTRPEDYKEESDFATNLLTSTASNIKTVLELGAGGGNNAFHLKSHFHLTLTDVSAAMLENSRRINPECEHAIGDMRTLRLGRQFDGVFIHDAISYMVTEADLLAAVTTASSHCRPGGVVLIMPDYTAETFRSGVHHGGHDGNSRALRYFEWTFDPNPNDSTYTVDFVYMLRENCAPVRVIHDAHTCGVFSRAQWMRLLQESGLSKPECIPDPWGREVFLATRQAGSS
jgi:trans-aconitate methyltransferase